MNKQPVSSTGESHQDDKQKEDLTNQQHCNKASLLKTWKDRPAVTSINVNEGQIKLYKQYMGD